MSRQYELFDSIPDAEKSRAAMAFESFKPTMLKLQQEGYSSIDKDWWRSRWHDWLGYKGCDTEREWKRKHELDLLFPDVWGLYANEFMGEFAFLNPQPTTMRKNDE